MDPFTQRMLERTKLRREKLEKHLSKDLEFGFRQPLQHRNEGNVVDYKETDNHSHAITKNEVQEDCISKIVESENIRPSAHLEQVLEENSEIIREDDYSERDNKTRSCKLGRLAELATRIKEWEDELDKKKQCTSMQTPVMKNKKSVASFKPVKQREDESVQEEKKTEKNMVWDKSMIKSLESQGYSLSQNKSRLTYNFEEKDGDMNKHEKSRIATVSKSLYSHLGSRDVSEKESSNMRNYGNKSRVNNENIKDSAVLKKAAFFESQSRSSPVKIDVDPIKLSIAERKALFEKQKGEALIPKVAFATPLPAKFVGVENSPLIEKKLQGIKSLNITEKNLEIKSPRQTKKQETPETLLNQEVKQIVQSLSENQVKIQKEKFERGFMPEKDEESSRKYNSDALQREKELECLKRRWDHNKNITEKEEFKIPEPPPMPPSNNSPPRNFTLNDKTENNHAENLRLYPSLSDFEESDSDRTNAEFNSLNESKNSNLYLNMSFCDILEAKKNDPVSSNEHSFNEELRESQVLSEIDEFLDNAFNEFSSTDNDYDSDDGNSPSPPKMLKSTSFEYKSSNEENGVNPLLHTVSFYRKQQQSSANNQASNSARVIEREETVELKPEVVQEVLVEKKIQELLQEVNRQQTIISQASQALNLCLSTVEFSGSGEQVESERLLLLANHKRQACLNEIQRLKVENTVQPRGTNQQFSETGDVTISDICVPLKRDALRSMAAVESMQYLVCLIKCDERVLATPAVPATRDNLKNIALCFPGQYRLENLLSDFKVTVEVYNLELNKEMLPHEIKYHIGNKKDKKLLTPIKSKKAESKMIMPCIQSPAGPNAVRSSNFHLSGYVVFSLREVTRTNWTLNKVPYVSPLEGSISMNIKSQLQLDLEFRGFLTMFDDISGFGAWHRRWCLLSSHTLSYWKYPDDETRKVPIGTIDLRGVVTEKIGLVSRDICARLFTFLLETTRPRREDDKESLVLNIQGDVTKIRHLLSADSKGEMLVWCQKLNTILALLRSWQCNFDA